MERHSKAQDGTERHGHEGTQCFLLKNFMSEKSNNQGLVISKCSMQQTNVNEGTRNQTEIEKQGSVLNSFINLRLQTVL